MDLAKQPVREKWFEALKFYHERNFNLLPIGNDKRPLDFLDWSVWQVQKQSWSDVRNFDWKRASGIAAVQGDVSGGLLCVDIDKVADNETLLAMLAYLGLRWDYQWVVQSGSGKGYHIWLHCPGLVPAENRGRIQRKAKTGGSIDLRFNGHYTILPPSQHPSGGYYEFLHGEPQMPLALMTPDIVLEAFELAVESEEKTAPAPKKESPKLPKKATTMDMRRARAYVSGAVNSEADRIRQTPEGQRNEQLYNSARIVGGFIGQGGLTESDLEEMFYHAALGAGLDEREIRPTIRSGFKNRKEREIPESTVHANGKKPPEPESAPVTTDDSFPLTDLGNARRLIHRYGGKILYCAAWESWLVWRKTRWEVDATLAIERMAKVTIKHIPDESVHQESGKRRKAILTWALRSQSCGKISAAINVAKSEPECIAKPDDFDHNPMLLNTLNCVIDLRTGEAAPHSPDLRLIKQVKANYDPAAECPTWLAFLHRIMDGNQNLIDFLQRAAGYSLTGKTNEQVFFILYGTGGNGKGTFINTLAYVLGDYARNTPTSTLMRKKDGGNGASDDLARLLGVRLVTANETEENQHLAEATIKTLTGQDTITARHLYASYFDFSPVMKIWLSCNHKPVITGVDNGIWRRIRLIPFTVTIPDDERIEDFEEILRKEADGILRWAVEGCLKWQAERLGNPPEVAAAVQTYRSEMDVLAQFLEDCCLLSHNMVAKSSDLYGAYQKWCEDNGIRAISNLTFGKKLAERGFNQHRGTNGVRLWNGLGLKSDGSDGRTVGSNL